MADNNSKAEKGIGGLYIDLGLRGLGNMIKGLNGVSANFLLTKNAIQQATKPLESMSRQASKSIVSFDKINAVTGISIDRLQELSQFTKRNNLDFGTYTSQLQKMQQAMIGIRLGDSQMLKGLSLLGIDPRKFSYKEPEKALDVILKKISQLDEVTGTYALSLLGLDSSFMYMMKRANKQVEGIYKLTNKQIDSLRVQNDRWTELDVAVDSLSQKFIASAPMQTGLKALIEMTKGWISLIDDNDGAWTNFKNNIIDTVRPLDLIWKGILKINDALDKNRTIKAAKSYYSTVSSEHPIASKIGVPGLAYAVTAHNLDQSSIANPNFYDMKNPLSAGNLIRQLLHPIQTYDVISKEREKNVTINVTQNISSPDSAEAASRSVDGIKQIDLNIMRSNNRSLR